MGIVTINGQKYDSVSGLQINEPVIESVNAWAQEPVNMDISAKPRRQSKQERLAEAVAQEFEDSELAAEIVKEIIAEPVKHEVPDWIGEFTERQPDIVAQPDWITNYVIGGSPIEIQPIGLEAVAQKSPEVAEQTATFVEPVRSAPQNARRHAPQHSSTLNRNFVHKPSQATGVNVSVTHRAAAPIAARPNNAERVSIEPITSHDNKAETTFAPVMTHSMEEKLAQREVAWAPQTSSELKNVLINEQMSQPIDRKSRAKAERKAARTRRRFAAPTLITAALAVLVLGGYFTYVSMPAISVRVAAARAGIDARAPYTPSGYSIDGPVAYAPGRVTINYKSNGGGAGYSITQQANTWGKGVIENSLLDGDSYNTIESGKTIVYRYGNKAAWVENDILYTLDANDSFGNEQITRIVDSL